jgi:glutamine---fructose-6-phosphate transaminase (isomerizing)
LEALPSAIRQALRASDEIRCIAEKYQDCRSMLFMGRQYMYPVALEGALKLKEISYIHAEGYASGEMKHGPIALVDEATPSVFLCPISSSFDKVMSNLEEVKARGGPVIAITTQSEDKRYEYVAEKADDLIVVPDVPEYLQPIVMTIPLQLFAYHMSLLRGCDVDKPRNLAKSVTVE